MKPNYWQHTVDYTREDGSRGSSFSACTDLDSALAGAFETATFYLVENGYPRAEITVEQMCGDCHGDGEIVIRRHRSTKRVKCKSCGGHAGPLAQIGPFLAQVHENAKYRCGEMTAAK